MTFRGLFVGIDRYASNRINELSCAKRDAVALHALFSDTLGDGAVLLTDEQATRAAIEEQFTQLAACDKDDVVVIAFSGHGTQTHELVTYDADLRDLAGSCIPLEALTTWFSRIPAKRLVCFLDCCFSGGMGAKVLHVDAIPRNLASADNLLDQLSGDGRLIFTASSATEEAWEIPRFRHSLMTYYLLEALEGADEVRQAGKIAVYQLLQYVTRRVIDGAAQFGKPQHPTLRGALDGEVTWPMFQRGSRYITAFPERSRTLATADVGSLAAFGFPPELLAAWAGAIPSLNGLQLAAINDFNVLQGEHLVVSAPTSSGKTMIGELAALKGTLEHQRALFLLPLKALVNDKHQHFTRIYGPFGLRVIRATGEIIDDIPALMRGQYDICLMTYEKFAALVLGNPHILGQVGTVVVDEVQMIADKSRGVNLEFILTLLRMRRREGIEPQLIALSAVIGDTNGLERWLGARLLKREERPVPLNEGILRADGSFRFLDPTGQEQLLPAHIQPQWGKGSSQDAIIPLVRRLVEEGKQVIVFREIRGKARSCALYLAKALGLPPAQVALDALPAGDPSFASAALREALAGGVAFHISDLDREERLVIEEQFRAPNTTLRVIAATTTLAMGVNTPASAVIIAGLEHPGPQGSEPYTVAEYKNITGRAGRLGFAEEGASYVITLKPNEEHYVWTRYVQGKAEDLVSRFLANDTDPRSLIVSVLVAAQRTKAHGMSAEDIIAFLEGSFGAYQQAQIAQSWTWNSSQLTEALESLQSHKLVEQESTGLYHLTPLGRLAGEARVEVESIIRLVDAFAAEQPGNINEATLVAATQLTLELDSLLFPMNKVSKYKEPQTWAQALSQLQVAPSVLRALQGRARDQQQATLRAKKAAACLYWMSDQPLAQIERTLTQFGGSFDGAAGPIRSVTARSCDLLPTVVRVAELLHPGLDLSDRLTRLVTRLEVGVPGAAVDLATQTGTKLSRGDYHRLLKAGLCAIDAIEQSDDAVLLVCLENNPTKLRAVRRGVQLFREQENLQTLQVPTIPAYDR